MHPRLLALVVALPAALAGCAEEPAATAFHATGTGPTFSHGWAYDGNVTKAEGEFKIDVDEATNRGSLTATLKMASGTWTILWTTFSEAPARAFQSGGIAHDLREHGATNVGDALVPELHLVSAGWGKAEIRKDGVPFLDPATRGLWSAHYMATDTGARQADGKIKDRSGGLYDPAKAAAGATEDDRELWIILRPGGSLPDDFLLETTEAVQSPQYSKEFPFTVAAPGGPVRVVFAAAGPPTPTPAPAPIPLPTPAYDLTFTLVDANGTEVSSAKNTGELTTAGAPGDYKVIVTGRGVQATYDLAIRVDYASNEPYVIVFEDASW